MRLNFLTIFIILSVFASFAEGEVLFEGDSVYHHITINQYDKERCMLFGRYNDALETCIDLDQVDESIFEYTEMMFVGFLFNGDTEKVLLIGLGGGYLPLVFRMHLPEVRLTVVEVDPLVQRLAEEYFFFQTSPNVDLIISDGRQYLKQKSDESFDQIWLDVFNSDYIPSHMTTREFLMIVKSKLSRNGVVVQNVFNNNQLYTSQVLTFQNVFKHVYVLKGARSYNSIIVASDDATYSTASANAKSLSNVQIGRINLLDQFEKIIGTLEVGNGKILTDDYSPANLLLHKN